MPWTTTNESNVVPKTQRMSLASFPGKSWVTDAIVIDAEDSDVIALAAHVSHKIEGILGIKRKKWLIWLQIIVFRKWRQNYCSPSHTTYWGRCNFWILWSWKKVGCKGDFYVQGSTPSAWKHWKNTWREPKHLWLDDKIHNKVYL